MPSNSLIARTDAQALIPEDASREIIQSATEQSALLQVARRVADMPTNQRRLPVLSALPTAYFVTGDTGHKQTTDVAWDNVYLNAEELAVIVPVPQAVVDDSNYDIWGQIRPALAEAFGRAIDAAMLFGTNKPTSWPTEIRAAAVAAGNNVSAAGAGDVYDELLGVGGVWSKVEADGYMVNGAIASVATMAMLRGLRDGATGMPIFFPDPTMPNAYRVAGVPLLFPRNGAFDASATHLFAGDWSQIIYAMRQDITYTIATEGVITDNAGNVVHNLFQQDMIALRAVMRLAFAVPNPINRLQETAANRYPIAVYTT